MAVWKKSSRRGSCSSKSSNDNYKPNSPAQASPAPRIIRNTRINNRNDCCEYICAAEGLCNSNVKPIRKRGRPKKHLPINNHGYFIDNQQDGRKIHRHLGERSEQSQLSEYELLNRRRREEVLSMFRELFSGEIDSANRKKAEENKCQTRRKYSRRPLPPSRPRSLRLLGLAPGQRPLRKRRHSVGPRCLCCWLPTSDDNLFTTNK